MLKPTNFESGLFACRIHAVPSTVFLVALLAATGCSFQNFDELTNGASTTMPSLGGATNSGGVGGRTSLVGGTTATPQGGISQGGTQSAPSQGGTTAVQGGASQTGGAHTGGASPLPCPPYVGGSPGTIVTPPSNSFESSMTGWSTVSERSTLLSLVEGSSDACQGSGYLQCAGSGRQAAWDGPALNVLQYLLPGHTYEASVAARFDPQSPPDAGVAGVLFSMALYCSDSSVSTTYRQIMVGATSTNWFRLTGPLLTSLTGCPSLSRLVVYVESDSTAATNTLQIDDFILIDTTPSSMGTGGAPGTGAGGSGPIGGSPPIGGATASGGAFPAGGAQSSGGTFGTGGEDAGATSDGGPDGG